MQLTLPIREVRAATPRARIVHLGLGGAAFPYLPGQAVLVGDHQGQSRRPYSIASAPEDSRDADQLELLVGVNAEGHPGSHLTLEPGAKVDVTGPLGRFTFPSDPVEQRFVFIAGGTGIAPLRAMLRHALHSRHKEIGLLYSARTPAEFAYEDELRALAAEGAIELQMTVTRDTTNGWTGPTGRIGRSDLAPLVHDQATLCFVCGPPALVEDMPRLLADLGVPGERVKVEEWS